MEKYERSEEYIYLGQLFFIWRIMVMSRRLRGKLSLHVEELKKLDVVKKSNLLDMLGDQNVQSL